MKKSKILLFTAAFALAILGAFATKSNAKFLTAYVQDESSCPALSSIPEFCVTTTETTYCTVGGGQSSTATVFQTFSGNTCIDPFYYDDSNK